MNDSVVKSTFALLTFGCKVNQYESHALREAWQAQGLSEESAKAAKTVCITTCAVTAKGVADARAAIRRAHRENPEAEIIVTGCAAQVFADEFRQIEGVTLVVPHREKARLLALPANASGCKAAYPPFAVSGYDRSRAVVKVQDGCSHRCTYCIVPLTRGPSVSRPPQETLAEVRRLLDAGFREIVVNGINLAQYGRDLVIQHGKHHDFWDLVALLDTELAPEWAGRARLRLSSLEPGQLGARAIDVLGASSLIAPQLHLSLQSGSREVLRRMGRGHYDAGILPDFCRELATVFPVYGLGADILSGFPGETAEQAAENEAFLTSLPFTYAHVFPYSKRPGTPAAEWPDQVPSAVKKERAARLRAIFAAKNAAFLDQCASLPEVTVAWEESTPGGVNEFYGECVFAPGKEPANAARKELVKVRPVGIVEGRLLVEPYAPDTCANGASG